MEKYAAYIYTSTSIVKIYFIQIGRHGEIAVTVYLPGGRVRRYRSFYYDTFMRTFLNRKIYYTESGKVYSGVVKLVLQGRRYYCQRN